MHFCELRSIFVRGEWSCGGDVFFLDLRGQKRLITMYYKDSSLAHYICKQPQIHHFRDVSGDPKSLKKGSVVSGRTQRPVSGKERKVTHYPPTPFPLTTW